MRITTEPLIITTDHPMHPLMRDIIVRTKFGRWLNSVHAHPGAWLIKQDEPSNAFGPNVFRAVVDDFGTLVPILQMAGFMASSNDATRVARAYVA